MNKEITKDSGAFLWVGCRDSNYEVWQFTEIDESVALGIQAKDAPGVSARNGQYSVNGILSCPGASALGK